MINYFLDYSGKFDSIEKEGEENNGIFYFKNAKQKDEKLYIVPIIYDVSFKKVFYNNNDGAEYLRDFLNSMFYPESKSIKEVEFLPKEILSNSHLVNNKGTKKVDNVCIATIMIRKKNEINEDDVNLENYNSKDNIKYKKVVIDVEMENNLTGERVTSKCFNYGSSLRMKNDFMETWVIALCIDKSKSPTYDKGSKCYVAKEYNFSHNVDKKDYVKIYEVYLNGLYNAKDEPISALNNEKIGDEGKEWIKLFCLTLWCNNHNNDKINFCIPKNLKFYGSKINKAIEILSDIQEASKINIKMQLFDEELLKESSYNNGYDNGDLDGYMDGYNNGFNNGFDNGYNKKNIVILDYFYKVYKEKKDLENTGLKEILDKVPYLFLLKKYGENNDTKEFANVLDQNGLLLK